MAGRNRNTFLKRQKEIERTRKAREKMARRHGKKNRIAEQAGDEAAEGAGFEDAAPGEAAEEGTVQELGDAQELVLRAE